MKISTNIEIELPSKITVSYLERIIFKAVWQAAKELFVMVLGTIENQALESKADAVAKQCRKRKWLLTRFGWIRFSRYKVRFKEDGRYSYLLDKVLGIEKQKATRWVKKKAAFLCVNYPYRQAASLLSSFIHDKVGFKALWGQTQSEGKKLREGQGAKREDLFERGVSPPKDEKKREIVVVQPDGTFISETGKPKGSRMEVKLAVMYTSKKLVSSKKAKYKRYELEEKTVVGSLDNIDTFGKHLSLVGEEKLALSQAQNVLLIADGDPCLESMGKDYLRNNLVFQLDHYHLMKNIRAICRGNEKLYQKLLKLAFSKKIDKLCLLLKTGTITGRFDKEKAEELATYLKNNAHGIWGSKALKDKVGQKEVLNVGSGVIEKNVDIVVSRRFKKRGMRWSKEGANNLLALRVLSLDENDWNKWWEQHAS
jgi:hypothetical protein